MRFAAIGLDHRHIYHLVEGLIDAGLSCAGYWPQTSDPRVLKGFRERFPDLVAVEDRDALMRDPSVDFIVCCASRSSASGKAYQIRFTNGETMDAEVFLRAELKRIEASADEAR